MPVLFNRHVEQTAFHDKVWKRAEMPVWDERWSRLSVPARERYLTGVKAAPTSASPNRPVNKVNATLPAIVDEWRNAGLIRDQPSAKIPSFIVPDDALGFTSRLRAMRRYNLLDASHFGEFPTYLNYCFSLYPLQQVMDKIVQQQTGLSRYEIGEDIFELFVKRRRWPDWVATFLQDPLAPVVVAALEKAGGRLPLQRLAEHLPGQAADQVRLTVDRLINHLALFEDLDPETFEIVVGLLPSVYQDRQRVAQGTGIPPLNPRTPTEAGPDVGMWVPDLRGVLLEIAGQPPRLKQNHSLYQKEVERFETGLDPLPDWFQGPLSGTDRLDHALALAHQAGLTHPVVGQGDILVLDLTTAGRKWLTLSLEAQYAQIFAAFREGRQEPQWHIGGGDSFFLASHAVAFAPTSNRKQEHVRDTYRPLTPKERQTFRDAVYGAFSDLPIGTFFAVEDFLTHIALSPRNPVLLGGASGVIVRQEGRVVPPLDEHREEIARRLLRALLSQRLIPLGCVQTARDAKGNLLFSRLPRLDVYFGKAEVAAEPARAEETRVVVQPDFSVIIIGLSPAPVADLVPFCERVRGRSSQGSLTFRITRDSVMKGLAAGLTAKEVMERLEKHSSTPLPKNVATEVRGWCEWMRKIETTQATLLRCPDSAAADRVFGALGKSAERISDTIVAIDVNGLTSAVRQKLQSQGILIEGRKSKKKK